MNLNYVPVRERAELERRRDASRQRARQATHQLKARAALALAAAAGLALLWQLTTTYPSPVLVVGFALCMLPAVAAALNRDKE